MPPDTETEDEEEVEAEGKNENEDEDEDNESEEDEEEEEKQRKVYTSHMCNKPMREIGHTHFRGIRYCPNAPNQIPLKEWLIHCRIEQKMFESGPQ